MNPGTYLIAGILQPASYSPVRTTISAMACQAGTDRWVMTGGIFLVGGCYLVTAAGLTCVRASARALLAVAGLAGIGIAASPDPASSATPRHLAWTVLGAVTIAVWPAFAARRASPRPLILSVYGSAAVTAVFVALLGWLLAETRCRDTRRNGATRSPTPPSGGDRVGQAAWVQMSPSKLTPILPARQVRRAMPASLSAVRRQYRPADRRRSVNRPRSAAVTCSPSRSTFCASRVPPSHLTGAAKLVVQCDVVLLDHAIDGPSVATRQMRGPHRILVIRHTGRMPDGMGSRRRRVNESAAEPRFARR